VTGVGLGDLGGVQGTLSAPGLTVLSPTATWPALGRGRTASNASPLSARTPAGQCTTKSALTVTITSSEGGLTVPVTVDPRPGSGTSVALRDGLGPAATPVPQTTEATFVARGSGTITDVDLRIDELRHTWLGDLQISLVSPAGTVVGITDGWGNADFGGDDVLDAVFDDGAPVLPTPGNDDPGPVTGRIRPIGSLSALNGQAAAGTWKLRITDQYPGDAGTLEHWGLTSGQVGCGRAEIPVAATAPAGAVAPSTATLNGTVTPNGRTTGLRFAYGTTSSYGQSTGAQDVGAGDCP
jgi:subtilisin-like proprotein convertase family protein